LKRGVCLFGGGSAALLDCGGKRSATPLFDRQQPCQSGVALRFPPQSKTPGYGSAVAPDSIFIPLASLKGDYSQPSESIRESYPRQRQ
jgi:hypothetical protein